MVNQVGGTHYEELEIQPWEYNLRNKLGWCEGEVVKYVSRWKGKNGVEDLRKAKSVLEFLISETIKVETKQPQSTYTKTPININQTVKHKPLIEYSLTDHESMGLD